MGSTFESSVESTVLEEYGNVQACVSNVFKADMELTQSKIFGRSRCQKTGNLRVNSSSFEGF